MGSQSIYEDVGHSTAIRTPGLRRHYQRAFGATKEEAMGWEDDIELEIEAAQLRRQEADARASKIQDMERELRRQAGQVLKEAVTVLRRHHVPTISVYQRHEGKPSKPRSSMYSVDDGILVNVASAMVRHRRPVYIDPSAPRIQAWEVRGLGGSWSDLLITEDGKLIRGHSLPIGKHTPRGGDRRLDQVPRAVCICHPADVLRLCDGVYGADPHAPHLEFDRNYEDAYIHGEPIDDWLKSTTARLVSNHRATERS